MAAQRFHGAASAPPSTHHSVSALHSTDHACVSGLALSTRGRRFLLQHFANVLGASQQSQAVGATMYPAWHTALLKQLAHLHHLLESRVPLPDTLPVLDPSLGNMAIAGDLMVHSPSAIRLLDEELQCSRFDGAFGAPSWHITRTNLTQASASLASVIALSQVSFWFQPARTWFLCGFIVSRSFPSTVPGHISRVSDRVL